MNDDLVPHAFQYLHYNKIFKESFPPGIRGNINQFGMNISYNVVKKWDEYMKDILIMEKDPVTGAQPLLTQVFGFR